MRVLKYVVAVALLSACGPERAWQAMRVESNETEVADAVPQPDAVEWDDAAPEAAEVDTVDEPVAVADTYLDTPDEPADTYADEEPPVKTGGVHFSGNDFYQVHPEEIPWAKTYSLWFRADDLVGNQGLVVKRDAPGFGSVCMPIQILIKDGVLCAGVVPCDHGSTLIGESAVVPGVWTHVVVQVSTQYAEMYVDGLKAGEVELPDVPFDNGDGYTIGATPWGTGFGHFYSGDVYNFRVTPGFVVYSDFEPCDWDEEVDGSMLIEGLATAPCEEVDDEV